MTKLGVYLVPSTNIDGVKLLSLVIAESATQAADSVAFRDGEPFEQTETPGRLGDYEPGFEGHNIVISRPRIVIRQEVG